jgi:hypothetical protein
MCRERWFFYSGNKTAKGLCCGARCALSTTGRILRGWRMSGASDISNLFQMVGGDPSQYKEVERTEHMQGSRGRWSMLPAAPVAMVRNDASDEADAVRLADTAEVEPVAPQRLIAWDIPAIGAEPPPVLRATPEQPVVQADVQASPEPVVAEQPSADLSRVFARLLERDKRRADASQRRTS